MKANEYRLNIRFDLTDDNQRATADFLRHLDTRLHGSINRFVIGAVAEKIRQLSAPMTRDFTLEDIRQLFREETAGLTVAEAPSQPVIVSPAELTEEQRQKNMDFVLDALKLFE